MFIELFLLLLVIVLLILILFLLLPKLLFDLADFFIERLQNLPSLEFEELNDFGLHVVDLLNHFPMAAVEGLDMLGYVLCTLQELLVLRSPLFLLLNELSLFLIVDIGTFPQILLIGFLLYDIERPGGFVADCVLQFLDNIFVLLLSLNVSVLLFIEVRFQFTCF